MSSSTNVEQSRAEWRSYWHLPFIAALGMSISVLHIYSLGPFMQPLADEFGWTRAQISSGITITNLLSAVTSAFTGLLVDRFGPRIMGIVGICIMCATIMLLSLVTGSRPDWYAHFVLVGIGCSFVTTAIWVGAVASRFNASRGLAVAITISGSGISATIMPIIATLLIQAFDWRYAFLGLGGIWLAVSLPLMLLFFRGAFEERRKAARIAKAETASPILPGLTVIEALRSPAFYHLTIAGGMFSFTLIGTVVHFVPILEDRGNDPLRAAGIAGIIGIASIIGRLGTGYLIDRFRGNIVGAVAFLLPILGMALLLFGSGAIVEIAAAIIFGLAVGSELDVISYLTTRYIGLRNLGALLGIMYLALSTGTAVGPLAAGYAFDTAGSYDVFLWAGVPLMIIGALALLTLGPYPDFDKQTSEPSVT